MGISDPGSGSEGTRVGLGGTMISASHTHTNARVDVDTENDVLPPYLDMVFCQSPDLEIDSGLIELFDGNTLPIWHLFLSREVWSQSSYSSAISPHI